MFTLLLYSRVQVPRGGERGEAGERDWEDFLQLTETGQDGDRGGGPGDGTAIFPVEISSGQIFVYNFEGGWFWDILSFLDVIQNNFNIQTKTF